MNSYTQARHNQIKTVLALIFFGVLGLLCSTAIGHEWTINGERVKAKPVEFDGANLVLENNNGIRKTLALTDLVAEDIQYLSNILSIKNAEIQKQIGLQQLRQQQTLLALELFDVWSVRLVSPNGDTARIDYFADNSLQAQRLAMRQYPRARVVGVQRMRRNNAPTIVRSFGRFQRPSFGRATPVLNASWN